jgi:hypothetical protein
MKITFKEFLYIYMTFLFSNYESLNQFLKKKLNIYLNKKTSTKKQSNTHENQ